MDQHTDNALHSFAHHHQLLGLSMSTLHAVNEHRPGYTLEKARQFLLFQERINKELLQHRVIVDNSYTAWFEQGKQSMQQIKDFIVQFSVFSNQFLIAQCHKMIHAETLEGMHASKEILANELGVRFNSTSHSGYQSDLGELEGSIEGSTFHFKAGHFEWLFNIAKKLDLKFSDIGHPQHGTETTLFFCNELIRLYGGKDYQDSQAASYAVENWAAAGFWKQLILGFRLFNQQHRIALPLGFFIWHDQVEDQHAAHTQEELEELYFTQTLDESRFIALGNEMLDGVAAFWDGLNEQRQHQSAIH